MPTPSRRAGAVCPPPPHTRAGGPKGGARLGWRRPDPLPTARGLPKGRAPQADLATAPACPSPRPPGRAGARDPSFEGARPGTRKSYQRPTSRREEYAPTRRASKPATRGGLHHRVFHVAPAQGILSDTSKHLLPCLFVELHRPILPRATNSIFGGKHRDSALWRASWPRPKLFDRLLSKPLALNLDLPSRVIYIC